MGTILWPIQTLIDWLFGHKEGSKMSFFHAVVSYPAYLFAAFFATMVAWNIFDYFNIKIL